jgi:hypothetical protein
MTLKTASASRASPGWYGTWVTVTFGDPVDEQAPPEQPGQRGVGLGGGEERRVVGAEHVGDGRKQVARSRRRVGHQDGDAPAGTIGSTAQLGDKAGQISCDRRCRQRARAEPVPGGHHPLERRLAGPRCLDQVIDLADQPARLRGNGADLGENHAILRVNASCQRADGGDRITGTVGERGRLPGEEAQA